MSAILEHFDALDRALAAKGFPATSPWWRETLDRLYRARRRQLVLRVGRRGGKSSTLSRIAVCEALFGEHIIPPGDVGVVAFISTSRDEAASRLRTIRAILDALGITYRSTGDLVELVGRPIAFRVHVATIAGVSGFTCICAIADEVAKWKDADSGANPASEVLGSLRPTLATQPNAKIFLSSSPLSTLDAHYDAFEVGENEFQCVAHAPTWEANPTITEEETHRLERDLRIWRREYLAQPQAAALAAFDHDAIARAFVQRPLLPLAGRSAIVIDASSGRKDAWTFGVARWQVDDTDRIYQRRADREFVLWPWGERVLRDDWESISLGRPQLVISELRAYEGRFFEQRSSAEIVSDVALLAQRVGARHVHGDQRESFTLSAAFRAHGLDFHEHVYTPTSKPMAVETVRRWLAEGTLVLPPEGGANATKLRRELEAFEERVLPSGAFTFGARGNGHDDFVALLLTAALAEIETGLDRSPHTPGPARGTGPEVQFG